MMVLPSHNSRLLALPSELRIRIYDFLLDNDSDHQSYSLIRMSAAGVLVASAGVLPGLALMKTCRLSHSELVPTVYSKTQIHFSIGGSHDPSTGQRISDDIFTLTNLNISLFVFTFDAYRRAELAAAEERNALPNLGFVCDKIAKHGSIRIRKISIGRDGSPHYKVCHDPFVVLLQQKLQIADDVEGYYQWNAGHGVVRQWPDVVAMDEDAAR